MHNMYACMRMYACKRPDIEINNRVQPQRFTVRRYRTSKARRADRTVQIESTWLWRSVVLITRQVLRINGLFVIGHFGHTTTHPRMFCSANRSRKMRCLNNLYIYILYIYVFFFLIAFYFFVCVIILRTREDRRSRDIRRWHACQFSPPLFQTTGHKINYSKNVFRERPCTFDTSNGTKKKRLKLQKFTYIYIY